MDDGEAGQTEEERRELEKIIRQAKERIESYRSLLDQSYEFLSPIMSHDTISNMPYRELLFELERRRRFLEENKHVASNKELEKQLKELSK